MEIRKRILSLLAVGAICIPMVATAYASEVDTDGTAKEGGAFTFSLTGNNPYSFGTGVITTDEGKELRINRSLKWNDTSAYNPTGFNLQLTATNLTTGDSENGYYIDNENLFIRASSTPAELCTLSQDPVLGEIQGNNDFQEFDSTKQLVHPGGSNDPGSSLDGAVNVVAASDGRGCGETSLGTRLTLFIPAGSYTAGGEAEYVGTLTLSNTLAPDED